MKATTLKDVYVDELRDLYNAEQQLIKALPEMAKAATFEDLRQGFEEHLEQTKGHARSSNRYSRRSANQARVRNARGWKESSRRAPK